MGYSRRKLNQRMQLLAKHIKKPINEVIKLMPKGFTEDMFVSEFQRCYRYLWNDIRKEQSYYWQRNKTFQGKKPLLFPSPERFVLSVAFHLIKRARKDNWIYLSDDERKNHQNILLKNCNNKIEARDRKQKRNTELLQKVSPGYADSLIKTYFNYWYHHPKDVDVRFYVLHEIARFNSEKHVGFMITALSKETNNKCREFALSVLQKWGKTVHLKKKRKSRPGDNIEPTIPENPTELLNMIEQMQMERDKTYNVFISHRSTERELVIDIKNQLNKIGYSVYVDWMIDKDGLEPTKYNENTWPILKHRMRHCDNVLYVHTASCTDSKWIPKEISYAKELSLPIFVLNIDNTVIPKECESHIHITYEQLKTMNKSLPKH